MKITRLHLLILGIGVVFLIFGTVNWVDQWQRARALRPAGKTKPQASPDAERIVQIPETDKAGVIERQIASAAQSIAVVGEAYRLLNKQFGDIPPIAAPLRAAKQYQAQGQHAQALASTRASWQALKAFRSKINRVSQPYQVARGDTLWRIAELHSPVRAGAGWVTIWKANRNLVSNFDRIEVGWTLAIPMKISQYAMPFWKPQ
ncbi:MAG: hypothetical protein A2992_01330 [Elusimicrobia bacterium RIFCSPLOWO2_01_FULL_59_12]|nr:MAG: hypothetical protein A2992_01330 [Elusimicrobia bacterium RIFCSPLOWO2_01_FULL_59_12]